MCINSVTNSSFVLNDLLVFLQTVDKLKIELGKNNISIIAVEGFEKRGDLSFQMDKLKVKIYVLPYKRWRCHGRLHYQTHSWTFRRPQLYPSLKEVRAQGQREFPGMATVGSQRIYSGDYKLHAQVTLTLNNLESQDHLDGHKLSLNATTLLTLKITKSTKFNFTTLTLNWTYIQTDWRPTAVHTLKQQNMLYVWILSRVNRKSSKLFPVLVTNNMH